MNFDTLTAAIAAVREKRLFFIGGAIKSGTTWLQLLLDQHPTISCRGEGHLTDDLAPALFRSLDAFNDRMEARNAALFRASGGYPTLSTEHQTFLWLSAMALLLHEQSSAVAAQVIGEKTPDNIRAFSILAQIFPNAKFIQIVRDGRDCAVSAWFHNLRLDPAGTLSAYGDFERFVSLSAEHWARDVGAGETFGANQADRYLAIRYEDLSSAADPTLHRTLRFLDVESDEDIRGRCLRGAAFSRLSGGREAGQEDRSSFFRRGVPGDWRRHFSGVADAQFRAIAGRWLEYFGYV